MEKPERPSDEKVIELAEKALEKEGELPTSELAKEINTLAGKSPSEATARAKLYTLREYMEKRKGFVTELRPDDTPGTETRYWRLEK